MIKLNEEEKAYKIMVEKNLKAQDEKFKKEIEKRSNATLAQKEIEFQKKMHDELKKDETLLE